MKSPVSINENSITDCFEYKFVFAHNTPLCMLNVAPNTRKILDVIILETSDSRARQNPRNEVLDFELVHDKPSKLSFVKIPNLKPDVKYTIQINAI